MGTFVERPMEPMMVRGKGMHVLGFVPRNGWLHGRDRASTKTSSTATPLATVSGPTSKKNGRTISRPVFERGNYNRYYGYRHVDGSSGEHDPRLLRLEERFGPGFFNGKEVLDVGCNAGKVSLAIAHSFGGRRVVGIDVDSSLIETAEGSAADLDLHGAQVEFRAEDILASPLRRGDPLRAERFDIITCLSVTKWIHFAHGDVGIRNLFKRFLKRLKPGGFLVLEPQEWKSYKKKRHLTKAIRDVVRAIELRPENFLQLLESLGFEVVGEIEPPQDAPACFKRTVYVYRRPSKAIAEEHQGDDGLHGATSGGTPCARNCDKENTHNLDETQIACGSSGSDKKRRKTT